MNGMGAPLLANYQSALLYPPNWFLFLLQSLGGIGWGAWGEAILAAAHLAWAGIGMALLSRELGIHPLGQSISGLAFGLSGYIVGRLGFLSINAAVSWLPWVILTIELIGSYSPGRGANLGLFCESSWRGLISPIWRVRWLAICLAMQLLAGHAQTAWYTLLLAILWGSARGWLNREVEESTSHPIIRWMEIKIRVQSVVSVWRHLALALVLAVGLSSVQLLPTAEYLLLSQRSSQVDFDFAMTYSFWPWRFLTMLAPDMFGNPVRGDFWGYGNYWEDALYIGLMPLILALAVIVKGKTRARCLLGLAIISMVLALGKNTPVFPWLYHYIPTFSMFQAPTRFSIWCVFALALLAGIGIDAWRRPTGRGLYWTRLATAGALAVTLGAGVAWYFLNDIQLTFLRATALAGMWGVGTGLLALLAPTDEIDSPRNYNFVQKIWPGAVVLFLSADLLVAGWGLNPGIDLSFYQHSGVMDEQFRETLGGGRVFIPMDVEEGLKFKRYFRFDTFNPEIAWQTLRQVILPNLNLLDGVPSANNFDPLVLDEYNQWMTKLAGTNGRIKTDLLNLMAVRVVEDMDSRDENGVSFRISGSGTRFRWVPCERLVLDAKEAWDILSSGKMEIDRQVVIQMDAEGVEANKPCNAADTVADIREISESPNNVTIQVSTDVGGWLVASDVFYPGWRATLNGEVVPIKKANFLFRAVYVSPGVHTVVFSYYPTSFYMGALISLLAVSILWVAYRLRR